MTALCRRWAAARRGSVCWRVVFACAAALEGVSALASIDVPSVEFDEGFVVREGSAPLDLSRFEYGNRMDPGVHELTLFVNHVRVGRVPLRFEALRPGADVQPVFDEALLAQMGVALQRLAPEVAARLGAGRALPVKEIIEAASAQHDFSEQRLDVSLPQSMMNRRARGHVPPEHWDGGVTAGILGYNASLYRVGGGAMPTRTHYHLGLQAGLNLGGWRLRHHGSLQVEPMMGRRYQSLFSYAQHDLTAWRSQLTLGEAYSSGELFDAAGFRGVRIASDERMLPESQRGYAPTVRGVAATHARVVVRQRGNVIHETVVAPGAFEIDDLFPTGFGGDLEVSVLEADGRVQKFFVPYAAVPLSLRPGLHRFSLIAGQLRERRLRAAPWFVEATWQRGITNAVTGLGGMTLAPDYAAVLVGGVLNTSLGALGLDVTQARTRLRDHRVGHGASVRATYSKRFGITGTHVTLAAYRYSAGGFFHLTDAMLMREQDCCSTRPRVRHRAQLSLSQRIGSRGGSVFANASTSAFRGHAGAQSKFSLGYSHVIGRVSYSVSATRQKSALYRMYTSYFVGISVPLGSFSPVTLSTYATHDGKGRSTLQSHWSATAGADNALLYSVSAAHATGGGTPSASTGGAHLMYRSPVARFSASASSGARHSQLALSAQGAVVAHPGGVTLSQPVSETIAIVEARGAAGARLASASGVRIDAQGYAVVPHVTPYSMNTVELDPKGLPMNVELQTTSQQIAPRAGAVATMRFATVSGRTALIQLTRAAGEPVPFGAIAYDTNGEERGVVGQASRLVARGLGEQGVLTIRWGAQPADMCLVDYTSDRREATTAENLFEPWPATCRAPQEPTP